MQAYKKYAIQLFISIIFFEVIFMKRKHKRKLTTGILILLCILAVSFFISLPNTKIIKGTNIIIDKSTKVSINGSKIIIDKANHHIDGELPPESKYEFLMKDLGVAVNTFSGDAFLTMMPLDKAEAFRAKYGDFFRCNAPGAAEAMKSIQSTILVTDTDENKSAIAEAVNLIKRSLIPTISFTGSRIKVIRQTYSGMNLVDNSGTSIYYVKSFTITKPDYF